MNRMLVRGIGLLCTAVLVACGGGGDGDGAVVDSSRPTSVSIDRTAVDVASTPSEVGPSSALHITVNNVPTGGLYHGENFSTNGLEDVQLYAGATTAQLHLAFKPATELADGVYDDTIHVHICLDDQCRQPVSGSPMIVNTRYTVSGGTVNSATVDRSSLSVVVSAGDYNYHGPQSLLVATAGPTPAVPLTVQATSTRIGIESVASEQVTALQTRVNVTMNPATTQPPGTHHDTVTVRVCYDRRCHREVNGSPMNVPVAYTVVVGAIPEAGVNPLTFSSRTALPHDVVDAKFSRALDALVMVSAWPRNSLYVYDAATGAEHEVALAREPKRLSISPDGTRAAVGHDALVSLVDLTTAGTPGAAAPTQLNVAATVGDLVLDGRGHVFVFPAGGGWMDIFAIDIATNTQTSRYGPLYGGTRAALHRSGSTIYTANNGLSPDDIQNLDTSSGQAVLLRDSPYHGEYEMCGNLWISDDGLRIYTACGRTFRAATIASQDMLYDGAMTLSTAIYGYRIASLSEWTAGKEIALIEYERYACEIESSSRPCWSHLNFYNSDTLNLVARYSLAPIDVAGTHYAQRGRFVFHRSGGSKLLVSKLDGVPNRAAEYHLSVLP